MSARSPSEKAASPALARFEAELRLSAEVFAARVLGTDVCVESAAIGFARRYGFLASGETSLSALTPAGRRGLTERLEEENRRLLRAARRHSAAYDLGRHIALRRALHALAPPEQGQTPPGPAPTTEKPLSGRELNRRFRRRVERTPPVAKTLSPLARRSRAPS